MPEIPEQQKCLSHRLAVRLGCQHGRVLVKVLRGCRGRLPHVSPRGRGRERRALTQDSHKDTRPSNPITSQRPHLLVSSHWGTGVQTTNAGETDMEWTAPLPASSHSLPPATSLFSLIPTSARAPFLLCPQPRTPPPPPHKYRAPSAPLLPGPPVMPVPRDPTLDLTSYPCCREPLEETPQPTDGT